MTVGNYSKNNDKYYGKSRGSGLFDFVIPSAFFLAREPALSRAEGNLPFR
jgi:hypothetical protein